MALSTGQINDAFSAALGRTPTGAELQQYSGDNSYEGDPGKNALISKLGGNRSTPSSAPGVNSGGNFEDIANRAIQMNTQAVQPVVQSLTASKQPLVDRYNALLGQIKNNQSVAENRQTVTTNNELGARGILPSSGLAQQTLTSALNPITQDYNATYGQAVAGENSDLNNIDNQIAQILSGAVTSGINTGANVYGQNLNYNLGQGQLAETTRSNTANENLTAAANALKQLELQNVTIPQSQAAITASNAAAGLSGANTQYTNLKAYLEDPKNTSAILNSLGSQFGGVNLGAASSGLSGFVTP